MKRIIAISAITVFFALSAIVSPARVDEGVVEKKDLKSVAVKPIEQPRDGKNVALTLEVKPATSKRLPRGVSIGINGKPVDLVDDGNWPDVAAGDGIYTIGLKTKDGKPLKEGGSLRLSEASSSAHHAFLPFGCTFNRVSCGIGCKSLIFRTTCVVCFELASCEI